MIQWIRAIAARLGRLFQGRKPELDRSRLVGMYLEQSNRRERVATHQERRDGNFAQNRRRC